MEEKVREIDLVIRNLGDNAPIMVPSRKRKLSDDSSNAQDPGSGSGSGSAFGQDSHSHAPVGLGKQFNELYSLLEKGLIGVQEDGKTKKTNVSALLMGGRGQGKSLVLERCLLALREKAANIRIRAQRERNSLNANANANANVNEQIENANTAHFRVVHLNGILLRGQNVTIVVQEIVGQLCEIVAEETHRKLHSNENEDIAKNVTSDKEGEEIQRKLYDLMQKERHKFRKRQTTFDSSMACLNEAFQISCIDSIPILIVLDELDSFLPKKNDKRPSKALVSNPKSLGRKSAGMREFGNATLSSSRDLLLYHLLDRIAGKGSLISLVGACARLTTLSSYEKRVRSRAQGTSKVVYFSANQVVKDGSGKLLNAYNSCVAALLSNFNVPSIESEYWNSRLGSDASNTNPKSTKPIFVHALKQTVQRILLPQSDTSVENWDVNTSTTIDESSQDETNRVHDIFKLNLELGKPMRWFCRVLSVALTLYAAKVIETDGNDPGQIPQFDQSFLIEGLKVMGAESAISEQRQVTRGHESPKNELYETTARLQDLMDLSGSQVAVLLSAKRLLKRDRENEDDRISSKPLTYERIRKEYESYFIAQGKSSGPDRYDEGVFFTAFSQMLGGMLFPAKDHTGGGPYQYFYSKKFTSVGIQQQQMKKIPLHMSFDVDQDLMKAIAADKMKCSAALKDWAK